MGYKLKRISEQIIRIEFIGDFTAEDTIKHSVEVDKILDELKLSNKQAKYLICAEKVGKISLQARRAFTERNRNPQSGAAAVIGMSRLVQTVARFVTVASGNHNIRFFDDEESALEWLKNSD